MSLTLPATSVSLGTRSLAFSGVAERGRRGAVLSLLCYTALAFLLFHNAWRAPLRRNIGFSADPQQFMWFLGWMAYALGHAHNPLISHAVDYPSGVNLMWNTSILLPSALLAPVTAWLGPIFSYNVLVTLALPLSAWCAFLAMRRWVSGQFAAALGGLVYGFSPELTGQAQSHPQVIVALAPPLALLLLDDLLVRQRRSAVLTGALLGVVGAAQLLTGEELLATTGVAAVLGILLLLVLTPRRGHVMARMRFALPGLFSAGAVFLALAAWPLLVQFRGPQRLHGVLHYGIPYASDLLNFVVPSSTQQVAPPGALAISQRFIASASEQNAYVGLPLLLLLGYVVIRWRSVLVVRWAGLLAAVMAVLSLGRYLEIGGHIVRIYLPWALFEHLPLLRHVLPCRLMVFTYLCIGLLVAYFMDHLPEQSPRRRSLAAAVVIVCLATLLPQLNFKASARSVPAFFRGAALGRVPSGSVALVAPFSAYFMNHTYTNAMLWQAETGMRFAMPEGYVFVPHPSGNAGMRPPPSTTQMVMLRIQLGHEAPRLTRRLRRQMLRDLWRWNVRTLLVGPMPHQKVMLGLFHNLLQRAPRYAGHVYVWWHVRANIAQQIRV